MQLIVSLIKMNLQLSVSKDINFEARKIRVEVDVLLKECEFH
ncbi:conserved hypothetical protein [Vibrio diabolicus]|nr:conserved hypothetical protein [Vibrio diabolicus]